MPVISESEGENFKIKAARGEQILEELRIIYSVQNLSKEQLKRRSELISELNDINDWFQMTAK